ncbi:transposase [Liquorilactobacillus mali]|uniref:transposase n=1 Tax=Liquorilactobacillus mali TaxID=1618 RepID=UPI0012619E24|nr:transposase [Liquorilactobacillus mali]
MLSVGHQLEKYFLHFNQLTKEKVKIIITDTNRAYSKLTKIIFPNSIAVIDSYHYIFS